MSIENEASRLVYEYRDKMSEKVTEGMLEEIEWEEIPDEIRKAADNVSFVLEAAIRDAADRYADKIEELVKERRTETLEALDMAATALGVCAASLDDTMRDSELPEDFFEEGRIGGDAWNLVHELKLELEQEEPRK